MARAMTIARIPAAYRTPLLGRPDPRLARCLAGSAGLGVLVLVAVLLTPPRHTEMRVEEVPRRLAKLILEPPKPVTPPMTRQVRAELPEAPPKEITPDLPKVAEIARADETPRVGQRRQEVEQREDAGRAGREQARQEVRESLTQTREEVRQTLAEVTAALSSVQSESKSSSTPRRGRPGGGRARGQLAAVESAPTVDPGKDGGGPVASALIDVGSITEVRSDLASADPSSLGGADIEPGALRSNASLLAVVRRYAPGIQYCYDNELKRAPELRGKMVLVLTVLANGVVSEVDLAEDTVGSARLQQCALAQVREWRFPPIPEGVVTFRTPFVFTPPGS